MEVYGGDHFHQLFGSIKKIISKQLRKIVLI